MNRRRFALTGLGAAAGAGASRLDAASAAMHPARLRCEYWTDPLGIDVAQPRLSWVLESNARASVFEVAPGTCCFVARIARNA